MGDPNALQWDGRPGHYEVYYLSATDRGSGCGEFAISVGDRFQRHGLGSSLLCALQSRAVSLGCLDLFGETLKTNDEMKGLARKAGFAFTRSPDWRAVRFDKRLAG